MTTELFDYMQGLPVAVSSVKDAKALSMKQSGQDMTLLNRGNIKRAISKIHPGEKIFFMEWAATVEVKSTKTNKRVAKSPSALVFFSTERFFVLYSGSFAPISRNVFEVPLTDICTVAASKGRVFGGISFRTQEFNIEVTKLVAGVELLREMVIHIASVAAHGGEFVPADLASEEAAEAAEAVAPRVIECPGCAATIIIHPGKISKCEYCGRPAV